MCGRSAKRDAVYAFLIARGTHPDIRDNAKLAQEFAAGFSAEEFKTDRRTFYAVTRCLEIISEAALRDGHPELTWRAMK